MKDPLCPLSHGVRAHLNSNQNSSNHKMEAEPTRAGDLWKMWILQSWKGITNNLQLPGLEKNVLLLVKSSLTWEVQISQ